MAYNQKLSKDSELIISSADKGDKIVVLHTSQYLDLEHTHLKDSANMKTHTQT